MKSAILIFLTAFIPAFAFGDLVGKANSPDYDSQEASAAFLISQAKVSRKSPSDVTVDLDAGFTHYRYTSRDDRLAEMPLISKLATYEPPRRWRTFEYDKAGKILGISTALSAAGGLALAGATIKADEGMIALAKRVFATEAESNQPITNKVALVVGGVLGGVVGYYFGFEDKRDYDSQKFRAVMLDKRWWRAVALQGQLCAIREQGTQAMANGSRVDAAISEATKRLQKQALATCAILEKEDA